MHAIYMIFYFIMPFTLGGLGNLLIPYYLHSIDMLLPRINNLSFLLLFISSIFSLISLIYGIGPASGWTLYPPLSSLIGSPTISVDFLIFALHLAGFSSILASINFFISIVCLINLNEFFRLNLFLFGNLVVAFLLFISLPVLAGAITLLLFDRNFNTVFYDLNNGGDVVLFQHLFWFFGHPEVYVLIIPSFVILTLYININFNNSTTFGYLGMLFALFSIGLLGCIVWAHHMFTVGMDLDVRFYYSVATIIIALPTGIKIFTWLSNFISKDVTLNPLIIFCIFFILLFLFGGLTGIILSNSTIDLFFHDSYFVVAHFHYVLSLGAVFGIFISFFYLSKFIFFFFYNHYVLIVFIFILFLSANIIFLPMHLLGFWGLPRRYFMFPLNFYYFSFFNVYSLILIIFIFFIFLLYNKDYFFLFFYNNNNFFDLSYLKLILHIKLIYYSLLHNDLDTIVYFNTNITNLNNF